MKYQFMVNANVREILFNKMLIASLLIILKIAFNHKEKFVDYAMSLNFVWPIIISLTKILYIIIILLDLALQI